MKSAVLLLNHRAGAGVDGEHEAAAAELQRVLDGAYSLRVDKTPPRELLARARAVVARKPAAVFVGGGDGTVSTVAGAVADTGIPLGVLPLGTLNHFARDLGFPADWRAAIAALSVERHVRVDLGELNGRTFVNNCSLGAYPEAVRRREMLRRRRDLRKWPAMFLAALEVFWRLKRLRLRIATPAATRSFRTPFVLVANNRYCGHIFAPNLRDRLDEGQLWIYTTRARRHGAVLRLVWQSLIRRIDLADGLESWPADQLTITSERPATRLPVALDGEVVDLMPPLNFRIRPRALTVFAPPPQRP